MNRYDTRANFIVADPPRADLIRRSDVVSAVNGIVDLYSQQQKVALSTLQDETLQGRGFLSDGSQIAERRRTSRRQKGQCGERILVFRRLFSHRHGLLHQRRAREPLSLLRIAEHHIYQHRSRRLWAQSGLCTQLIVSCAIGQSFGSIRRSYCSYSSTNGRSTAPESTTGYCPRPASAAADERGD